jgi:hypothetical protein
MEMLHIARFQAEYHLPPAHAGQKKRLDRLLGEMLDGSLALALERLGIPLREEICIRRIQAPVRLRMAANDSDLVLDWSMALADHLSRVITGNDPANVIRYPSRFHGLADFADSVARGDLHHAWAWKQLGFPVRSQEDSLTGAAQGLVASLMRESAWIVPILVYLAGTGAIDNLLGRLPVVWWQDLAMVVLMEYGQAMPLPHLKAHHGADDDQQHLAARIVRQSSLAAVVARRRAWFSDHADLLPLWSVLVILETEPALLMGETGKAADVVGVVQEVLIRANGILNSAHRLPSTAAQETEPKVFPEAETRPQAGSNAHKPEPEGRGIREREGEFARLRHERTDQQIVAKPVNQIVATTDVSDFGIHGPVQEPEKTAGSGQPAEPRISSGAARHDGMGIKPLTVPGLEPLVRSQGLSEYGGLLFLLPLLEQTGIVAAIVGAEQFKGRSLRWFLHALALQLLPLQAHDPAALAFCGLRPDDPMPGRDEPGPDQREKRLLAEWRLTLVERLADLMPHDQQQMDPERILHKVCHRNARIIADPGWIEVIFSIREVVTEIRRAGLDLDPGFIPWLGVVMKFYYE